MGRYIEGINKKRMEEEGLDLKDIILLRYIVDFIDSKIPAKKMVDGKDYYWIRTRTIIEDNKILNITQVNSMRKRIRILIDKGYLEYINEKRGISKTLYRKGIKLKEIEDKDYKKDFSEFKEKKKFYKEEYLRY